MRKTPIAFEQGRINSGSYVDIIADNLLTEEPLITSVDYLFQQDNASEHVSKASKSWFDTNFMKLFDWPARSLDLNPMENLRGILVREVYNGIQYSNGIQYQNKLELMPCIKKAWKNISKNDLKELSNSMTSRLIKKIEKKGAIINY